MSGGVFASMPASSGEPAWLQPAIDRGHDSIVTEERRRLKEGE